MSPDSGPESLVSQPESGTAPSRKRRRVGMACISCRNRKSRCSGQRPRCSTCTELDLKCEYVSNSVQPSQYPGVGREHLQRIEARLHVLEQVVGDHMGKAPDSCYQACQDNAIISTSFEDSQIIHGDFRHHIDEVDNQHPIDPTNGMGHFVFADEEDRAFFGPSSSIAFTSEVSAVMARLDVSVSEKGSAAGTPNFHADHLLQDRSIFSGYRIARVPRRKSFDTTIGFPEQQRNGSGEDLTRGISVPSTFQLPSEGEASALIDKFFKNTALLFPYIHEHDFRRNYAKLREGNSVTLGRTWLGLVNMVLAMATYTSVKTEGHVGNIQTRAEAFYQRASQLCNGYIMKTASLEIVQYLLLVSQYMQGNKSSIQTSATHGLAVKIAMQLGLHSTGASKRFPPLEREIRKRVWFGCIVLDRSLSMSFGRPASIPEAYCRLDLPIHLDSIEESSVQTRNLTTSHQSTDFFRATIQLYYIMGQIIDLLYDGNLGCGETLPNYELTISIMKVRRLLEEWVRQLPLEMTLISRHTISNHTVSDVILQRFRMVLTLRYNNLRVLAHRVVLVRICDLVVHGDVTQPINLMELRDIEGSAVEACAESSIEIIDNVHFAIRHRGDSGLQLLGAWWFTLYYVFDAAMVLFTILLLLKRSKSITIPPTVSVGLIQGSFFKAIDILGHLDKGSITIERCYWCLKKLGTMLGSSIDAGEDISARPFPSPAFSGYTEPPGWLQPDYMDPGLAFLNFDFMGNERLDFMGVYEQDQRLSHQM